MAEGLGLRRGGVGPRARPFERIAAFENLPLQIAGGAGRPTKIFELVVVRLEIVIGDAKSWIVMSSGRNFAPYLCVRCVLRTKSDGRKRNVSAFQWTPPPPTPVMGMNAPQSRIGSACSLILLRKVNVSCSGRRKSSWRIAIAQFVLIVGGRKIGRRVAPWPPFDRDDVETLVGQLIREDRTRPAEADDRHILFGQLLGHGLRPSGLARVPIRPSLEADGRTGIAFVMSVDPVAVVVPGAGIADHAPRAHVAIAAVNRIGEKSLPRVRKQQLEERLSIDAVQLRGAAL